MNVTCKTVHYNNIKMSTKRQHVSGYTRKNGTVVSGYDRTMPCRAPQITSRNFGQRGGWVSKLEREYVNDRDNFKSDDEFIKIQEKLKDGDEAHKNKEYYKEGMYHRYVQEEIQKRGGIGVYDWEGKKAYGLNSLYIHHGSLIENIINNDGFSFNDAFYYNNRDGRYYLTQKGHDFAVANNYSFFKSGVKSVMDPNGFSQKQTQQSGSSYVNFNDVNNKKSAQISSHDNVTAQLEIFNQFFTNMLRTSFISLQNLHCRQ